MRERKREREKERVCVREIVTEDLRVARRRRESVYVSERKYFECVRMCVYHRERGGERGLSVYNKMA